MLKVTGLWERTSAAGNRYLVGRLAGIKVLILENRDRVGDNEPTHTLFFVDGAPRQEGGPATKRAAQARPAQRYPRPAPPSGEPLADDDVGDLRR
jgi:hypothetical protein